MADPTVLVPLTVAVPLATAALLAALAHWLPRRCHDLAAIAAAGAVTVMAVILVFATRTKPIVYWFSGWRPVHGTAIGIDFVVEPGAAALAALTGLLTVASLMSSWLYTKEVGHLYHALVLTMLAGMVGFVLSADLFNIFVWLELMSVAAYALCGYQIGQAGVVQGAINFAVINTAGSLTLLLGIALVYGHTGVLNLSQIGEVLRGHPHGGPVVVAFTLITVGLLVKAGAVPFHFWLSDAYTVVPAPVGALFTGVMSDLAYHAHARIYWDGFAEAFAGHRQAVGGALLVVAVASVVVGSVMALLEADLKRQLAFATVAHGGIVLFGMSLLTPRGLAGATLFVITDGLLKAALFLLVGYLVRWLKASDELMLHSKGRRRGRALPAAVLLGSAAGFALLPPFGPFLAAAMIGGPVGHGWGMALVAAGSAATAAVFLRAGARIFLGWGPRHDPALTREPIEPQEGEADTESDAAGMTRRHRVAVLGPPLLLVLAAYGVAFVPGVAGWFTTVAHTAQQPLQTAAHVLHGRPLPPPPAPPRFTPPAIAWLGSAASVVGAVLLAAAALWWQKAARPLRVALLKPVSALKAVHDGAVGDYALGFAAGLAVLGVTWSITLR